MVTEHFGPRTFRYLLNGAEMSGHCGPSAKVSLGHLGPSIKMSRHFRPAAEVSKRHFGTGSEMFGHFGQFYWRYFRTTGIATNH
jgi:hypothetical protein